MKTLEIKISISTLLEEMIERMEHIAATSSREKEEFELKAPCSHQTKQLRSMLLGEISKLCMQLGWRFQGIDFGLDMVTVRLNAKDEEQMDADIVENIIGEYLMAATTASWPGFYGDTAVKEMNEKMEKIENLLREVSWSQKPRPRRQSPF